MDMNPPKGIDVMITLPKKGHFFMIIKAIPLVHPLPANINALSGVGENHTQRHRYTPQFKHNSLCLSLWHTHIHTCTLPFAPSVTLHCSSIATNSWENISMSTYRRASVCQKPWSSHINNLPLLSGHLFYHHWQNRWAIFRDCLVITKLYKICRKL